MSLATRPTSILGFTRVRSTEALPLLPEESLPQDQMIELVEAVERRADSVRVAAARAKYAEVLASLPKQERRGDASYLLHELTRNSESIREANGLVV